MLSVLWVCVPLGATLLTGSDDTRVCIWNVLEAREGLRAPAAIIDTGHGANIFCVRYMPATGTPLILLLSIIDLLAC